MDEIQRIRELAVETFEGLGVEVSVNDSGQLVTAQGIANLDNLIERCRREPESRWRVMVFDHLTTLIEATAPREGRLDEVEFRQRLRARVFGFGYGGDVPGLTYMTPVVTGVDKPIKRGLCLDFPEHVQVVSDKDLAGRDVEELWRAGISASCAEPFDSRMMRQNGMEIGIISSESWYGSARLLDVNSLIAQTGAPAPFGMVIAVPTRGVLLFHRPTTRDCTMASVRGMVAVANQIGSQDEAPVSSHLYYWDGSQLEQLTAYRDGGVTIESKTFRDMVTRRLS